MQNIYCSLVRLIVYLKYTKERHLGFPQIVRYSVNHREMFVATLVLSLTRLLLGTVSRRPLGNMGPGSLRRSLVSSCLDLARKCSFKMVSDEAIEKEFEEFSIKIEDVALLDKCM